MHPLESAGAEIYTSWKVHSFPTPISLSLSWQIGTFWEMHFAIDPITTA